MNIFNKIEYYGNDGEHWSGSLNEGFDHGVNLNPCAFCGGSDQKIVNTHTDYYWISCACGVELRSGHIDLTDGISYSDLPASGPFPTKSDARKAHEFTLKYVIDKWNRLTNDL